MSKSYFKGYWMVTNRCNLKCSYCVLENAPEQLKRELNLEEKKQLVSHLYHQLGFRRLTLSGGEIVIIGKRPPNDFIELLNHIRTFRSPDPEKNLEIEMYTNGTFVDEAVADAMEGVVDTVAVTIDSTNNEFLTQIGRNNQKFNTYYKRIIQVCQLLGSKGIELKLHSVVGQKNHQLLPEEVLEILDALKEVEERVSCWKFYQYMSYDLPERDQMHAIPSDVYETFVKRTKRALEGKPLRLHFKDNEEMNQSLFNILSYGNAQYTRPGDTWSTNQRTEHLCSYKSMSELFAKNSIDETLFRHFHELKQ